MKRLLIGFALLLACATAYAQDTGIGFPPYASMQNGNVDSTNLQNLNAHIEIPIVSAPGRGMNFAYSLVYDSEIYRYSAGPPATWSPTLSSSWGWQTVNVVGSTTHHQYTNDCVTCPPRGCGQGGGIDHYSTEYYGYVYVDPSGTQHPFGVSFYNVATPCGFPTGPRTGYALDGSGYYLNAGGINGIVYNPGGKVVASSTQETDPNGNVISASVAGSVTTWTDTRGANVLIMDKTSNPVLYKYQDTTGTYQQIQVTSSTISIKTNFACSGVVEYTGSASLPTRIDLPNGQFYTLSYEPTPNMSGYYTGRLQRLTLPTGGYYEYDYPGPNDGVNCADGTALSMNRVVSDGTNTATWNYVRTTTNRTTTITTPKLADTPNANDMVVTFNSPGQETSRKIYANSPGTTLLRTINTTRATNGSPVTKVTILEDGSTQSEVDTTYDSNGLLDSISEYDWGSGARGALLRTTALTYQTSTNYTSLNILNRVTSTQVMDGNGIVQYRQDIAYDATAGDNQSCPTGVPQHNDASYGCTFYYRGNPTSVTTYLAPATASNPITKNLTYDFFGNLLTAQLNCCQNKSWTYSLATNYSHSDSVTSGTSPTYNAYTAQPATFTDENNLVTNFSYDTLRRPTRVWQTIGSTNGASVSYSYDDTHLTATSTTSIDSSKSVQRIAAMDGLGRPNLSTTEDASNNVISKVNAQYDLVGRAYQTSNPYTGTSASYWTTTAFDVLGRPTSVTLPDNSATSYSYTTNTATVTDPTGKQRKSQSDGLGRLSILYEPDPTSNNQLTLQTSYTYNVLDALTKITQGVQTRTYVYDALGRLLSTTTPEAGTVCFGSRTGSTCNTDGYDSFDDLLKRTDARGVLTSYAYDTLNRLSGVSYNVSGATGVPATATVTLAYGSSAAQFNNGRLITMTDAIGSENYTYNNLGNLTQLQKVVGTATYTTSYAFNIAGELTQITYPSNRVVQQSVDAIGRLCEVAPSTTGCGTASSPFATGFGYNVASQVTGLKYGNGIFASFGFSSDRLQLNCLDYSTANRNGTCAHDSTTKFGLTYSYGSSGSNNGQIGGITDSVDNGRSATYSYDALYRLTNTSTAGSTNYPAWGLSETYDRYGNRSAQGTSSGCTGITCPMNSVTINTATNRITGSPFAYDLSGNMTNDGNNTLIYDAENRVLSATNGGSAGAYVYDGNGLRVKKCVPNCTSPTTSTVYVFAGSKVIAEYDNGAAVGFPSREYIYSGGALIAKIDSAGTKYYHKDHLSNRLVTDSSGNTVAQMGHFPYGESWYNASGDKLLFTSYERDAESGNDYAQARYDISGLGRFSSPDPIAGTGEPQSLNRYAYVQNDPSNAVDPSGRRCFHPFFFKELSWGDCGGAGSGSCAIEGFAADCGLVGDLLRNGAASLDYIRGPAGGPVKVFVPGGHIGYIDYGDYYGGVQPSWGTLSQFDGEFLSLEAWLNNFHTEYDALSDQQRLSIVARGVVKGAGAIGDWRFIAGFYALSALGGYAAADTGLLAGDAEANSILGPRVIYGNNALQTDLFHAFPNSFDSMIMGEGEVSYGSGTYIQYNMFGGINGYSGTFQVGGYWLDSNSFYMVHHVFIP